MILRDRDANANWEAEADGDMDTADYTQFNTHYSTGTMPFADWNWDGAKVGGGLSGGTMLSVGIGDDWPLPNWCKKKSDGNPTRCARCCETNARLMRQWCRGHYAEGSDELQECEEGVTRWYLICAKKY